MGWVNREEVVRCKHLDRPIPTEKDLWAVWKCDCGVRWEVIPHDLDVSKQALVVPPPKNSKVRWRKIR